MEVLHIMPSWFWGTNLIFECLFFIFAVAISFYAFRIYKFTNQRESKIFGLSFSFLAIAHFFLIILNSFFLSILQGGFRAVEFGDILGMRNLTAALYICFLILGLITLSYMSLKIKSLKTYFLVIILSASFLLLSTNKSLTLYTLSAIFLFFIALYYAQEFKKTHNKNTLLVFIGFTLLFLSNLLFALTANYLLSGAYVLSYLIEALGYASITMSLINVFKYGKKKK